METTRSYDCTSSSYANRDFQRRVFVDLFAERAHISARDVLSASSVVTTWFDFRLFVFFFWGLVFRVQQSYV